MAILAKIDSPQDLHLIKPRLLSQLAREIREEILRTAPKDKAALQGSLGAVELTIALHTVFQAPEDKLVWDTGHQTYAHKLLTGRRWRFQTIRQYNGLSGYPSREESPYDAFGGGHSASGLSAALGMAVARDQQGQTHDVVAVLGDGALTSGVSFEALQNAGQVNTGLIVILNDNEMFLSHRVAALGTLVAKVLTLGLVTRAEKKIEKFLQRIHFLGTLPLRVARRFKVLLFPGMLFEEMGFTYLGPIEGHDIAELQEIFKKVKGTKKPVLLHVITKKWRTSDLPARLSNGEKKPTYPQILGRTLLELARRDPKITAVTASMSRETGLEDFWKEFPERATDVGVAEQHAVVYAAGQACEGLKPVVAIRSTYLQRAMDNVYHDVCLQKLPVVLAVDGAGLAGEEGPAHHGVFDIGYLRMIPGLAVLEPANETELQHMLATALQAETPCAIRYPKGPVSGSGLLLKEFQTIPWGKAQVLKEGRDVTILTAGPCVADALEASNRLAVEGISCGVVNLRFLKPLDVDLLKSLIPKTQGFVTLEEHALAGGLGSAVREALEGESVPIRSIGLPDHFVEQGPVEFLREKYGLTPEKITSTVREFCQPWRVSQNESVSIS